jgi:hypothetical protein
MKTFKNICAQGEIGFRRLPEGAKPPKAAKVVAPENGRVVIGHSENGAHHVMTAKHSKLYKLPDELLACLVVTEADVLTHLREFDTHEPIAFEPGVYEVHYLREETPEGFRRQTD